MRTKFSSENLKGRVAGSCEHGNEPLGSVKGWEFLKELSDFTFTRRTLLHWVSWL